MMRSPDAEKMSMMLPDYISYKIEIIYIIGVLELLGAIGILISKIQRFTGICLILMFVGFLPANIYAAINYLDFGGHVYGPKYLLFRIPLQLFFIWWTYRFTIQLPSKY